MSLFLLVLAIIAFVISTVLGYGFVDDPDLIEDYPGWVALGLVLFALSFIPWDRARERWHR